MENNGKSLKRLFYSMRPEMDALKLDSSAFDDRAGNLTRGTYGPVQYRTNRQVTPNLIFTQFDALKATKEI
jgi:hypothetical protein